MTANQIRHSKELKILCNDVFNVILQTTKSKGVFLFIVRKLEIYLSHARQQKVRVHDSC